MEVASQWCLIVSLAKGLAVGAVTEEEGIISVSVIDRFEDFSSSLSHDGWLQVRYTIGLRKPLDV